MNSVQLSTQGISPIYVESTISNGYVIGEDSLTWTHYAWPNMALGTQSFTTCISYSYQLIDTFTCCIDCIGAELIGLFNLVLYHHGIVP